jgi:hypothetical protein
MNLLNNVMKFVVAILGAAEIAATNIWPATSQPHWLTTIIAGITAVMVYLVPNTPKSPVTTAPVVTTPAAPVNTIPMP